MNAPATFDSESNGRSKDREVLTTLFGDKVGRTLFGAAVRISSRYGIDLDDVTQEIALAGSAVEEKYGFLHVNSTCWKARDALTKRNDYGVNAYYSKTGVSVTSYDRESGPDGDEWVLAFADEGFDWDRVDTTLSVREVLATIEDPTDRAIAEGFLAGRGPVEISEELGIHYTTVVKRRKRNLAPLFEDAL